MTDTVHACVQKLTGQQGWCHSKTLWFFFFLVSVCGLTVSCSFTVRGWNPLPAARCLREGFLSLSPRLLPRQSIFLSLFPLWCHDVTTVPGGLGFRGRASHKTGPQINMRAVTRHHFVLLWCNAFFFKKTLYINGFPEAEYTKNNINCKKLKK